MTAEPKLQIPIGNCRVESVQGDITEQQVDAIINAANSKLAGGGGVDGAIHRRGGPAIMQETARRYPQGCPTGSAVITGAGRLFAKYVIHTVGPVWRGGEHGEPDLLASAYRKSLQLALEHQCETVAAPLLSTGAYGYPLDQASVVAMKTAIEFLRENNGPGCVRFVLFHVDALAAFNQAAVRVAT
jgi:O-acetyl-ADP-ribose deacetylase (regulator of RNase III)